MNFWQKNWKEQGEYRRVQLLSLVFLIISLVMVWCVFVWRFHAEKSKDVLKDGLYNVEITAAGISKNLQALANAVATTQNRQVQPWAGVENFTLVPSNGADEIADNEFTCHTQLSNSLAPRHGLATLPTEKDELLFLANKSTTLMLFVRSGKFCAVRLSSAALLSLLPSNINDKEINVFALATEYRNVFKKQPTGKNDKSLLVSSDSLLLGATQLETVLEKVGENAVANFYFLNKPFALKLPEGVGLSPVAETNLYLVQRSLPSQNILQSVQTSMPVLFLSAVLIILLFVYISARSKELYKPLWRLSDALGSALKTNSYNIHFPSSDIPAWNTVNSSLNLILETLKESKLKHVQREIEAKEINRFLLEVRNELFSSGKIKFSSEPDGEFYRLTEVCYIGEAKESVMYHAAFGEKILFILCAAPTNAAQVFIDALVLQLSSTNSIENFSETFSTWLAASREAMSKTTLRIEGSCFAIVNSKCDLLETGGEGQLKVLKNENGGRFLALEYCMPTLFAGLIRRSPDIGQIQLGKISFVDFK